MSTRIAFDVDDCLVFEDDSPNWDAIDALRALHKLGCYITVWSGGGDSYAKMWVRRLNLTEFVSEAICKPDQVRIDKKKYDICFDDKYVDLALVNIKV